MRWTKLNEVTTPRVELSPSELPMLGAIGESDEGCTLRLKYLTGEGGHRIWRDAHEDCVEFAEHPFRVLKVYTRGHGGCTTATQNDYAATISAFLDDKAPDDALREVWKSVMHEALVKIFSGNVRSSD